MHIWRVKLKSYYIICCVARSHLVNAAVSCQDISALFTTYVGPLMILSYSLLLLMALSGKVHLLYFHFAAM